MKLERIWFCFSATTEKKNSAFQGLIQCYAQSGKIMMRTKKKWKQKMENIKI
jgi:hypothetical protein